MFVDCGRHAWVGILDFHGATCTSGSRMDLVLMLSAIIIGTHMKLLDAWVVTLGVGYCPVRADVGRHTWVGIFGFS